MRKRTTAWTALTALALLAAGTSARAGEPDDAAAKALAKKEIEAHGGKRWDDARYFRFDFIVDSGTRKAGPFSHAWDRYTGRYRLEVPGEKGYVAYFNVQAPKDLEKAVLIQNGAHVTGEAAEKLLASAYARFINDSYWLLAPLKVLDPGVHLSDEGETTWDGRRVRVLKLSFEGVGLTPGDVYRHFLDPATGEMLGWEYQLQKTEPPPTSWRWIDVKETGGLRLSTAKKTLDGAKTIRFENLAVSKQPDEKALTPPSP